MRRQAMRYNLGMACRRCPEDLSVEELQRLLIEKRRAERQSRLERFRRSGRAVVLAPDEEGGLHSLRSASPSTEEDAPPLSPRRRWLDRILLAVEVLAVMGLVLVLLNGFSVLQQLNREVAGALQQPTLTPTPLVMAVVLPGGHTPPTSPGGSAFNKAEIPEHLRPLVQSLAALPLPTPGPGQPIRIRIPALDVDAPVVEGDGWEQLKKGVGHHIGSANPGQRGNMVLSGHNDIYGEVFRDLNRLAPGDKIIVYARDKAYIYIVTEKHIVEPTDVQWLAPTKRPAVTLVSCYPYMVDNKHIVVRGVLQGEE
jgi:sortase A